MSLSGFELRLLAAIQARRSAMIDDLRRWVAIPTGRAPHPRALEGLAQMRSIFTDRLAAIGCSVELLPGQPRPGWLDGPSFFTGNVPATPAPIFVARREPGGAEGAGGAGGAGTGGGVLLSGHLDTVHDPSPDCPFAALSIAPDGTTATGPGVVDMKGGLVIALHALEALAELDALPPLSFILNSDEETGSFCSDAALRAEGARAARAGYAMALALEPAAGEGASGLVTARGGSGQCIIIARGTAAHVGRDFAAGRSATDALARAIVAAHALTDPSIGRIVNVSTLFCDQPSNQVSDFAAAWGNLRYQDQPTGQWLRSQLQSIATLPAPASVEVDVRLIRPAKPLTPATTELAQQIKALAARMNPAAAANAGAGADEITFTTTAGVCDGNNIQAGVMEAGLSASVGAGGVGLVGGGVGGVGVVGGGGNRSATRVVPVLDTLGVRGGGLHTTREWIDLSSLTHRAALLAALISGAESKP